MQAVGTAPVVAPLVHSSSSRPMHHCRWMLWWMLRPTPASPRWVVPPAIATNHKGPC